MEEDNFNKIIFNGGGVIIFVLIILLSGCIMPSAPERGGPFEKVFNREAEDEEGYKVIDFVEKADILDFLGKNSSSYFIRNILEYLIDVERSYSSGFEGFLHYSIVAEFISISNYTENITLALNQLESSIMFPDTTGKVGYISDELGINETQIEELSLENDIIHVLGKTNLSENIWLVTVIIHAWRLDAGYRVGQYEQALHHDQIFLLDPIMNFIAIFSCRS